MSRRNLPLIIDDSAIRKSLFKTAADILKKIEKMEADRDSFHEKDQSLFRDWYNLTFKTEIQRAEAIYQEYAELAHLHNSVLAQAELHDQSLREALAAIRREEKNYAKGTDAQKKKIEAERLKREEFLKEATKEPEPEELTEKQKQRQQQKNSFYFFEALLAAISQREGHKILKMWDEATPAMREEAEASFQDLRGASLTAFIEKLAEQKQVFEKQSRASMPESSLGEIPLEQDIKVLYRKLARRLHPDVAQSKSKKITPVWIQLMWLKVQAAYKAQDVESLQRLDLTTLIRMEELNNLSLDEIRASHVALTREFQDLKSSVKELKKHPAWRFSVKKASEALKRKIREQLRRDIEPMKYDLERLREVYGGRPRKNSSK